MTNFHFIRSIFGVIALLVWSSIVTAAPRTPENTCKPVTGGSTYEYSEFGRSTAKYNFTIAKVEEKQTNSGKKVNIVYFENASGGGEFVNFCAGLAYSSVLGRNDTNQTGCSSFRMNINGKAKWVSRCYEIDRSTGKELKYLAAPKPTKAEREQAVFAVAH